MFTPVWSPHIFQIHSLWFSVIHWHRGPFIIRTNVLLQLHRYCKANHTANSQEVFYFVKYREVFQVNVVELDDVCNLFRVPFFCTCIRFHGNR